MRPESSGGSWLARQGIWIAGVVALFAVVFLGLFSTGKQATQKPSASKSGRRPIDNGFIVPALTWFLRLYNCWGVTSHVGSGQFPVDVFLVFCWVIEGFGLWWSSSNHWVGCWTCVLAVAMTYRLADLTNVLLERLVFGAYGPELAGVEASRERGLLLGFLNVPEVIVLHAGLFRIAAVAWPNAFETKPRLATLWDALELSAGRATTVGSRFALVGHGAVLLGISETAISVLIVVMLISQLASKPVGEPLISKRPGD